MRSMRITVIVAVALMLGAAFVWAGAQAETAAETTASGALKVEFWNSWSPDGVQGSVLQSLMNEFNEQYEGEIFVMPIFMGEKRNEKIAAALAAGDPPDIAWISNFGENYYEAGQLLDMERVYEHIDRDDLIDNLVEAQTYLGEDISLPFENSNLGLLYDRRKLQEAGISEPSPAMGKSWTWSEFIEAAKQFSDPSSGKFGWEPRLNTAMLSSIFWEKGGEYLSKDMKTNLIVSDTAMREKMVDALYVIHRMLWEDRITSNDVGDQGFGTMDMVFEITGPWDIARNLEPNGLYSVDRLGVAPMPADDETGVTITRWYQKSLAVFKTNPSQEHASLTFLEWFYSPEVHARWCAEAGYLPVTKSAQKQKVWTDMVRAVPQVQVFIDQAETMRIRHKGIPYGDLGTMLDTVRFQKGTPEEAVEQYVQDAQIVLDDFWARQE